MRQNGKFSTKFLSKGFFNTIALTAIVAIIMGCGKTKEKLIQMRANIDNPTIKWTSCPTSSDNLECGSLIVPRDYDKKDGVVYAIALKKINAPKETREGVLLINPGGPGGSGVDHAQSFHIAYYNTPKQIRD